MYDKDVSSIINEYQITDVGSVDEIVDAIYYLLLDINGVDIIDRTSYMEILHARKNELL